jgi:hypothetical protein
MLWQTWTLILSDCNCRAFISQGEAAQLGHIFKLLYTYQLFNLDPGHSKRVALDKLELQNKALALFMPSHAHSRPTDTHQYAAAVTGL